MERGRGVGGFEGKRTGSSMSAHRRRRDREHEGGVGPDVRATQHKLAPEPRPVGSALDLSVHLSQSRGYEVAKLYRYWLQGPQGRGGAERQAQHDCTYGTRAFQCTGTWRKSTVDAAPYRDAATSSDAAPMLDEYLI